MWGPQLLGFWKRNRFHFRISWVEPYLIYVTFGFNMPRIAWLLKENRFHSGSSKTKKASRPKRHLSRQPTVLVFHWKAIPSQGPPKKTPIATSEIWMELEGDRHQAISSRGSHWIWVTWSLHTVASKEIVESWGLYTLEDPFKFIVGIQSDWSAGIEIRWYTYQDKEVELVGPWTTLNWLDQVLYFLVYICFSF